MKNKSKNSKMRSLSVILLAFCVAFTSLPMLAGGVDASAMAKKKAAKNITLKASASGQSRANLSWNKIRKPEKGYAVFRDGRVIAHLGKKKLSYTDTGLSAGTSHYYQIKVYKTKKIKQWYNKKTGLWQKRRPPKKYRGKKRTITKYTYKKPSKAVYIKTAAASKKAAVAPSKPSGGGSGTSGGGSTPVTPSSNTVVVTDYLGREYVYTKLSNGMWQVKDPVYNATFTITDTDMKKEINRPDVNHEVSGEFTISGGAVMIQKGGITFHIPETPGSDGMETAMFVYMYNGDVNKLDMSVEGETKSISTYTYSQNPIKETYAMTGKYRLVKIGSVQESNSNYHNNVITKTNALKIKTMRFDHAHCGFVSGNVNIRVSYDFNGNGAYEGNEYIGTAVYKVSADPARAEALEIARKATANTNSYDDDMAAIKSYLLANYRNSDTFESDPAMPMSCVGGVYILETWSIEKYGIHGYASWGSCPPGSNNYGDHVAFYPEPNNLSGREYYEATGRD